MPNVTYIEPSGNQVQIDVPVDWSLMQSAVNHGVEGIAAECGGSCACATCHCYVEGPLADSVPPPAENELAVLGNVVAARQPNSRLSCQIKMSGKLAGLVVRFPDAQT
jgi:2Fe-2S ferredoxin